MEITRKSRVLANRYKLLNFKLLYKFNITQLREIYNGCGPYYFPVWARAQLDKATRAERPAFLIHDVEFELGGPFMEFVKSNLRLTVNCWKCANHYYSAGSPFRWQHKKLAVLFGIVCLLGGWKAWERGGKKEA